MVILNNDLSDIQNPDFNTPHTGPLSPEIEAKLQGLENIAWTMENLIPLPATSVRLGLDSFLGIIPIFGDIFTVLPAIYVIRSAAQLGASRRLLIRMCLNVAVDLVTGLVPIIGDVFDATWNASTRNTQLLRFWLETGSVPTQLTNIQQTASDRHQTANPAT